MSNIPFGHLKQIFC